MHSAGTNCATSTIAVENKDQSHKLCATFLSKIKAGLSGKSAPRIPTNQILASGAISFLGIAALSIPYHYQLIDALDTVMLIGKFLLC